MLDAQAKWIEQQAVAQARAIARKQRQTQNQKKRSVAPDKPGTDEGTP